MLCFLMIRVLLFRALPYALRSYPELWLLIAPIVIGCFIMQGQHWWWMIAPRRRR